MFYHIQEKMEEYKKNNEDEKESSDEDQKSDLAEDTETAPSPLDDMILAQQAKLV